MSASARLLPPERHNVAKASKARNALPTALWAQLTTPGSAILDRDALIRRVASQIAAEVIMCNPEYVLSLEERITSSTAE